MHTDIKIITMKDVMELYGLARKEATKLLKTRGCPLLPRVDGGPYRVVKDEFEAWLRSRKS